MRISLRWPNTPQMAHLLNKVTGQGFHRAAASLLPAAHTVRSRASDDITEAPSDTGGSCAGLPASPTLPCNHRRRSSGGRTVANCHRRTTPCMRDLGARAGGRSLASPHAASRRHSTV